MKMFDEEIKECEKQLDIYQDTLESLPYGHPKCPFFEELVDKYLDKLHELEVKAEVLG